MKKTEQLFQQLKQNRLIALLTPRSVEQCVKAFELLEPHGITLEIAMRSEYAISGIKAIMGKHPDALILAGTVMTWEQAEDAIRAGVSGVVSADFIPGVVEICVKNDIMCIPGGLSDAGKQLVQKASLYECGLDELREKHPYQWIYKLFPAVTETGINTGIAGALQGPYKGLNLVYTGGIDLNNLSDLAKQAPEGIFCGSALLKNIDNPEKTEAEIIRWKEALSKSDSKPEAVKRSASTATEIPNVVITFGEIMLRLSPPGAQRFVQANSFDLCFGGAEANTAVAFANYGLGSTFVTALPDHEIGQAALNSLRNYGVDTGYIRRLPGRLGIYYLEYGASQRPSKVIYDRAGSTITQLRPGQIPWDEVFNGAGWFHWSGITPALGENSAAVVKEALISAKKVGIKVSVDLNYRSKLWSENKAQKVMTGLMDYVDVCIGNEEDAGKIFGIRAEASDTDSGVIDEKRYEDVARKLLEKFRFEKVAITLRKSISASDNLWSACLFNGSEFLLSREYPIHIIDRVGGGDSFSSGLIFGLIKGWDDRKALEFGVTASCLKQTIPGDYNLVSVEEVEKLMASSGSGRIQR